MSETAAQEWRRVSRATAQQLVTAIAARGRGEHDDVMEVLRGLGDGADAGERTMRWVGMSRCLARLVWVLTERLAEELDEDPVEFWQSFVLRVEAQQKA